MWGEVIKRKFGEMQGDDVRGSAEIVLGQTCGKKLGNVERLPFYMANL